MQIGAISALVLGRGQLTLERLVGDTGHVRLQVAVRRPSAPCPVCERMSARVHGRYSRTLADLPWHGLAVVLSVEMRRFVCATASYPSRVFCERLSRTTAPYARRTTRLRQTLELIGLALGGESGARLAAALGMGTAASADTVLRLVHRVPSSGLDATPELPVRVLGIDDWAWRKGQHYGTILVDLERHGVLDLLPDREPETLAAWLAAHPSVEVISRDRSGAYAEAARQGAQQAMQVAGRFHRFHKPTDACLRHGNRHRSLIGGLPVAPGMNGRVRPEDTTARGKDGGEVPGEVMPAPPRLRPIAVMSGERQLDTSTVSRSTSALSSFMSATDRRSPSPTRSTWYDHLPCAGSAEMASGAPGWSATPVPRCTICRLPERRWAEGCHHQRCLKAEVRVLGYRGGHSALGDWVRRHLGGRRATPQPSAPVRRLTAGRAAWAPHGAQRTALAHRHGVAHRGPDIIRAGTRRPASPCTRRPLALR